MWVHMAYKYMEKLAMYSDKVAFSLDDAMHKDHAIVTLIHSIQ